MEEGRVHFLDRRRQGQPQLQPVEAARRIQRVGVFAFGMDDAVTGDHQVDVAGRDHRRGAERIAVHDVAFEQVGHGRQVDVRMRADIDALARAEVGRPHMVEEDPRPDHAMLGERQDAANVKPAQVLFAGRDDPFDAVGHDIGPRFWRPSFRG